jgi:intracellular multiplication protein IcmP
MAGGGGGGQASPGDDSALNVIWGIVALFAIILLIWFVFSEQLKNFFILVKKYELTLVNIVVIKLPLEFLDLGYIKKEVADALSVASSLTADDLTLNSAEYISLIAGNYLRYPIILCLLYFAYFGFFKNVANKYKKYHNMRSLAKQESVEWPQIKPVIGLDLVNAPLNTGSWAMGKTPVDFCKENGLIQISIEENKEFVVGAPTKYRMTLDPVKAASVFAKQLGKLWHSPESLAIHRRALFTVFLARGCRDTKVANNLLTQINKSCDSKNPNKLNFQGIDAIWPKYYSQPIVKDIIKSHAYEFTIFIDLLLLARQDGVLANSDFLWLKPIDRLFWYVLCSTGRKTYFVEAAGTHAHFLVEKALGKALSVPYVAEAVKALNFALEEIVYVPTAEEKEQLQQQA